MRNFFKWFGIVLGSLLGLVILALVVLSVVGGARMNRTYDVQVQAISIPTDAESIAAGEHWAKTICIGCHQPDLSGGPFFAAPFGYFDAANLTPGQGGLGASYSDEDWIRSIRHGLRPDNGPSDRGPIDRHRRGTLCARTLLLLGPLRGNQFIRA